MADGIERHLLFVLSRGQVLCCAVPRCVTLRVEAAHKLALVFAPGEARMSVSAAGSISVPHPDTFAGACCAAPEGDAAQQAYGVVRTLDFEARGVALGASSILEK